MKMAISKGAKIGLGIVTGVVVVGIAYYCLITRIPSEQDIKRISENSSAQYAASASQNITEALEKKLVPIADSISSVNETVNKILYQNNNPPATPTTRAVSVAATLANLAANGGIYINDAGMDKLLQPPTLDDMAALLNARPSDLVTAYGRRGSDNSTLDGLILWQGSDGFVHAANRIYDSKGVLRAPLVALGPNGQPPLLNVDPKIFSVIGTGLGNEFQPFVSTTVPPTNNKVLEQYLAH
jgi:hypothetical protein